MMCGQGRDAVVGRVVEDQERWTVTVNRTLLGYRTGIYSLVRVLQPLLGCGGEHDVVGETTKFHEIPLLGCLLLVDLS